MFEGSNDLELELLSLGFLVGLHVRCLELVLEDFNCILKMVHSLAKSGEHML